MPSFSSLVKPIEQEFNTQFINVNFNFVLNRDAFKPVADFIKLKVTGLGMADSEVVRVLSVAQEHAPNFYAIDKADCFVSMFSVKDEVVTKDAVSVKYLTGKTLSIASDATKDEWIKYISDSVIECDKIFSKPCRTAQIDRDIKDFIAASNKTIVDSFNVVTSKEKVATNHEEVPLHDTTAPASTEL
jgi:hypothetical protein